MDFAWHKKHNKENDHEQQKRVQRQFRPQWLEIEDFKLWLREVPNTNLLHCSICDRSFSFLGGLSRIYAHAETTMHKNKRGKSIIGANEWNEDLTTQTNESPLMFDERKKQQKYDLPH